MDRKGEEKLAMDTQYWPESEGMKPGSVQFSSTGVNGACHMRALAER